MERVTAMSDICTSLKAANEIIEALTESNKIYCLRNGGREFKGETTRRGQRGKTLAVIQGDVCQTDLKKGDEGYIDGYAKDEDNSPCAVFIRLSDGYIDLVPFYIIKASTG